jgi:hypothetical protein
MTKLPDRKRNRGHGATTAMPLMQSRMFHHGISPSAQTRCDAAHIYHGLSSTGSKPIICDTSPISWQVFKGLEPVEMVDGKLRYSLRFGQPHVDRDATPPLFV